MMRLIQRSMVIDLKIKVHAKFKSYAGKVKRRVTIKLHPFANLVYIAFKDLGIFL